MNHQRERCQRDEPFHCSALIDNLANSGEFAAAVVVEPNLVKELLHLWKSAACTDVGLGFAVVVAGTYFGLPCHLHNSEPSKASADTFHQASIH